MSTKTKLGAVTAYADAVAQGFAGSREEFGKWQADAAKNAQAVAENLEASGRVLEAVTAEGEVQIAAVGAASEVKIGEIDAAAEVKKESVFAEIEAKGAATLATIPEDYTALSALAAKNARKADAIVSTASGEMIEVADSSNNHLFGLKIYGQSPRIVTNGNQLLDTSAWSKLYETFSQYVTNNPDGTVTVKSSIDSLAGLLYVLTGKLSAGTYTFANLSGAVTFLQRAADDYSVPVSVGSSVTFEYDGTSYLRLMAENQAANTTRIYKYMLNAGTTAKAYEVYSGGVATPTPEKPQNIIGAGTDGNIELTVAGKNLLNLKTGSSFASVEDDGSIILSNNSGEAQYPTFAWMMLPAGKYYITARLSKSDGSTNGECYIQRGASSDYGMQFNGNQSKIMTLDKPTKCRLMFKAENGVTYTWKLTVTRGIKSAAYSVPAEIQTLPVSVSGGLYGIKVTSGGNYTDADGQMWLCDEIDFAKGVHIQRTDFINVYAGEEVGDIWMSSTGELSDGAEVLYAIAEPIETPLSEEEIAAYRALRTNHPYSTVYTDDIAEIVMEYAADTKTYTDTQIETAMERADEAYSAATEFDYARYGLPVVNLSGDTTGMNKDNAVTLDYKYNTMSGTCTIKWQGSSSLAYPKKNYTIKFDTAFEAVSGWGEQKKYCLKANYIDFSHARNLVCAKLWGKIVKSRANANERLNALPNGGAVDGFPVVVVINGKYMGLYTFNIPKDGWMYGMGDGEKEAILCADAHSASNNFKAEATLNGDFDVEYVPDENDTEWVKTSLNTLINACINSDGADLDTTIAQYLDWDSAIDYYIFVALLRGDDMTGKNYLLHTYDGVKWAFGGYDMDSTFGLYWDGTKFLTASRKTDGSSLINYATSHRLMQLIKTYKKEELKARYEELRNGAMSEEGVILEFANFIGKIPKAVYDEECRTWTKLNLTSTNNLAQIQDWYRRRSAEIDAEINAL